MRALLKALTFQSGDQKRARRMVAELLATSEGFREMLRQLPVPVGSQATSSSSRPIGEVYAFLGYITKVHSYIPTSLKLYNASLRVLPKSVSYALNMVHVYEIADDYSGAIKAASNFFEANPTMQVGPRGAPFPVLSENSLTINDSTEPQPLSAVSCSNFLSVLRSATDDENRFDVHWVNLSQGGGYLKVSASKILSESAVTEMKGNTEEEDRTWNQCLYNDVELDLLALYFTVVKILYLQGSLSILPLFLNILEPLRLQSEKPLHETSIRNEHAYYQEVAHVLSYRCENAVFGIRQEIPVEGSSKFYALADPLSADLSTRFPSMANLAIGALEPLYILGDSHCLPAAWSVVNVRGKPRLLVPKLVTGVKQWHLRSDGNFYPKVHFRNMIESIPDNAEVCCSLF